VKTQTFQNEAEWLDARRGKITGSRLKDIITKRGTGKKMGFYELIAERLAVKPDDERPIDRGHRLESEAIERFVKETGKKVDTSLIMWVREDDESIAISPDGIIGKTEAVEVKCLSSALHIKAIITKAIPDEYEEQAIQYFIVNDKLKKLYFVFYDPRFVKHDYYCLEFTRKDFQEKIDTYLAYQRDTLAEVNQIVSDLSF